MQTITFSGQTFSVCNVTGKVEDAGKNLETRLQGHAQAGYAGSRTSIQSRTVVHDQFFITDDAGQEHSFQLQNFDVACRSGNRLSVVWLVKQGKKSGPYAAVYNHSTATAYYNTKAMVMLFRRPLLYLIGVLVLFILLGAKASFFYWLLPITLVGWHMEGVASANRFKKNFDFNRLNGPQQATISPAGTTPILPTGE